MSCGTGMSPSFGSMSEHPMTRLPGGRIQIVDALRGLSILLMVAYHAGVDLFLFGLIPETLIYSPLLTVLQPLFAGVFIFLSGLSSQFSKSNYRRGVLTLLCAFLVSVVTGLMDVPVTFGILHFLGSAMLLYGLLRDVCERWPLWPSFAVCGLLFAVCFCVFPLEVNKEIPYLYVLGIKTEPFQSADYFPLLRWLPLFGAGTFWGRFVIQGGMPTWFYTVRIPFLPAVGRRTLLIYLLHQPVVYGIVWLIRQSL